MTRQFDRNACLTRNRIAAKRDSVNATPILLFRQDLREELAAKKTWPSADECLARINALLPDGSESLGADDVYIHLGEAANTNFIDSRYMFLAESTLKNCARDACNGVAFMNSHRTGGMSHPSEQPFGKTFWGQYVKDDTGGRTLFGIYMLKGASPTGTEGPTTDDLSRMIDGGTAPDVSVGLYGGDVLCDVCSENLDDYGEFACGHVPGTYHGMGDKDKKSQKGRGVPDGKASYSLHNSRMSEVSSVYDGAVPGAGFKKALRLASLMNDADRQFARNAYLQLSRDSDFGLIDFRSIEASSTAVTDVDLFAGTRLEPDSVSDAPGLTGLTFDEQLEAALAAVHGCATRAEDIQRLRSLEGRCLSAARLEKLGACHEALGRLLANAGPKPDAIEALRADLLREELRALTLGAIA